VYTFIQMRISCDPAKDAATREARGFGFDHASLIFLGPTFERPDMRRDYGEDRINAVGEIEGVVYHVTYTQRGDTRHIISARLASRKERRLWHSSGKP
jgi:uncharacterized protein